MNKEQVKKLLLGALGLIALLYVYFSFFLGPLNKSRNAVQAKVECIVSARWRGNRICARDLFAIRARFFHGHELPGRKLELFQFVDHELQVLGAFRNYCRAHQACVQ